MIDQLDPKQRVSVAEITNWLPSLPQELRDSLQLNKAQQNVINGRSVIRIPLGGDLSLFFTKENGVLKQYIYKWVDTKPGERNFTGEILSYSFQDDQLRGVVYQKGKIVRSGQLSADYTATSVRKVLMTAQVRMMDGADGGPGTLASIICFLMHGTMVLDGEGIHPGWTCHIDHSLPPWLTNLAGSDTGDGSGGGLPPGVWYGQGPFTPPPGDPTNGGYAGGPDAPYGGGAVWVTKWIPGDNSGCPTDSGDGSFGLETDGGDGTTYSVPCDTGHWETVQVDVPVAGIDFKAADDDDLDNDSSLTYDNYDVTAYAEYVQTNPWPNVPNVISKTDWVPYDGRNCRVLSEEQIKKAGYLISALDAPGQTIQTYTESNGANANNVKSAVSYLNSALQRGIPVVVGVDDAVGGQGNSDKTTNHFIAIVGMGSDSKGNFYRFFDSSTKNKQEGTSDNNKLYYNTTTNLITGSTQSAYGTQTSYMHPYIISQVRKSKHQ